MNSDEAAALFLGLLQKSSVSELRNPNTGNCEETYGQIRTYESAVSAMVNSFCFNRDQVLHHIISDQKLAKKFAIVAITWVEAMGKRYNQSYQDLRDKAAVLFCHEVMQLPEAQKHCIGYDTTLGYRQMPYVTRIVAQLMLMHPTNRQTFSGFVLSFLLQYEPYSQMAKVLMRQRGLTQKIVAFPMV